MAQPPNTIQCGTFTLKWGETITEMKDSTNLRRTNNLPSLRSNLANDGYILLRDQIDTKLIDDALNIITHSLHETWHCVEQNETNIDDLYVKNNCSGILLTGYKPITHHSTVQSLLHCDTMIHLMNSVLNAEAVTYDTKWVRVKATNEYTEQHSDFYRFSENCDNMLTVWMPLMDIPIQRGPLAVCPKSHLLNFTNKNGYYEYDMDEKSDDELPSDFEVFNESTVWKTTNFEKGDLLIFDIRTVHASLVNNTDKFRISIDTRWQPKYAIPYWNESFVRFKQNDADIIDLNDIMMDCTLSDADSDDDVVQDLDFEAISKRFIASPRGTKSNSENDTV